MQRPAWWYEEVQIGKDYNTSEEVQAYDARHGRFRDIERENEEIVAAVGLAPEHSLIEFGSGTGSFALRAAQSCSTVYAVDISRTMLEYAESKSTRLGIKNIVFCNAGFLTYEHRHPAADAIVSCTALHHLPDFWKGIALQRLGEMLKVGGHLYLSDVIFSGENISENIERWIQALAGIGGEQLRADAEAHIRKEFSTFDWVIEGLLEKAGFQILNKRMQEGVIGRYLCQKLARRSSCGSAGLGWCDHCTASVKLPNASHQCRGELRP